MPKALELKGEIFGRLVVIDRDIKRNKQGSIKWLCKCRCGKEISATGQDLRRGRTKSCGCLKKEGNVSHGLSKHPLYKVYSDMKARCYNTKREAYKNYGGRGITICDYWLEDFMNFYNDMIEGYSKKLQIDRKDNDKGYYKDNCRWITGHQNQSNTGSIPNSSSKYKGVSWNKRDTVWRARFKKGGKEVFLGNYKNEMDAAKAYNDYAFELNGEYAYLNKVD